MSDELTVANERQLLQTLLERVGLRASSERAIEQQHAAEIRSEQEQYQAVFQLLTETYDAERAQLEQSHEANLAAIEERCQSESADVQSEYQRVLSEAEDRFNRDSAAATKEHDDAVWLVSSLLDDDSEGSPLQRLQQSQAAYSAAEIELGAGLQNLDSGCEQVVRFLQKSHLWSEPGAPEPSVPISAVDEMKSACLAAIAAGEPLRRRILGRLLPLLFRGVFPALLFVAVSGVLFGLIWTLVDPNLLNLKLKSSDRDWLYIAAGIASAIGFLSVFFLHLYTSRRVWPDYEALVQQQVDAHYCHSVWEKTSKTQLNMLEAECSHLQDLRVKRRESAIGGAQEKLQTRMADVQRIYSNVLRNSHANYPGRLNELEMRRARERQQIEQKYEADSQELLFRRENDFRKLQSEFDARTNDSRHRYQQTWMELIRAWQSDIARFAQISDGFRSAANAVCPTWDQVVRNTTPFPTRSPAILSLGNIEADLDLVEEGLSTDPRLKTDRQRFDVPILLPLHERPSLILKAVGAWREVAVKTLQSTMLRFLTSLPPGKVRFTILDPVGLGANFSAFMHLADYDELLVTNRIWTEPSHIEKKLADLTEHMETVLQTYLRNEFPTIDDYNEFAGEVAEPYRVLVVANFPVNFTDIALRRLASIADGGRRCGVFLLMSFDTSQEIPRGFASADLEKYATVLEATDDGFRLKDPELSVWPLALEQPPDAEEFGQIVRLAGQHSRDVRRVEVPFERVAPADDQFWTSDSRSGIDVPIGRAGATKLQSLRLGKGTSQHVLVAGKTGSGKSTLLHALITNLALYYSPAEIEFYLIDFKKGVEFKVYAEQRLPHARVIAIESDREFGVSVLERLDALLRDRGELFREAGVQDIAGFRTARPDAVMPRTLLLVDEFQEFFIEDDAMSQKASLLLDRLIRQGRAFGVHILLGSQTLAGAYSLARSTLGQVAVRIALQCSETDAHLILSEENTAARLLTRPGEAIYNDANGLIEGNHPFQVVWLNEDVRERYLHRVREQADRASGEKTGNAAIRSVVQTPALVFEGNIPADPTANRRLQRVLAKARSGAIDVRNAQPASLDSPWTCWLGDSVSMSGPLELSFGLRDGGNVLVVGRDDAAAMGVMSNCALALAAQATGQGPGTTIQILDGSLPNSDSGALWRMLESIWNSNPKTSAGSDNDDNSIVRISVPKETANVLGSVAAELNRRTDEPGPPMFLFVYDLARFRDLRKSDDDYGYRSSFGGGEEKPVNPAELFSEILRDGPAAGIFTFVWVDSLQTAQRWLSRDQMNRFEQRVVFAMNANDSSSLIDSPLAGRLGENRAMIYRGDTGTIEKFRPFSPPPSNWLRQLADPTTLASPLATASASRPPQPPQPIKVDVPQNADAVQSDEISDDLPSIDELNVQ